MNNSNSPPVNQFQAKLDKLEALLNELDLFIRTTNERITICDFDNLVRTNGISITQFDFKRFKRELEVDQ